ncbi:MAG TPA: MFS transporter, partial [Vicinamibacterales bacterium]
MTRLVLQLHAGFVLAGMGTTLLGPVIPILTAAWGLDDREAGRLFAAQFGGALTATSVSALVARRIGAPRTLAAGFLLFAAGIGAIGVVPREAAIAAALTFGLGQGLVLPLTNIAIATLYPARPAGALSLVNVSWGVGAVLWPLVVGALARPDDPSPATTALASGCCLSGVAWLFTGHTVRERPASGTDTPPAREAVPLRV